MSFLIPLLVAACGGPAEPPAPPPPPPVEAPVEVAFAPIEGEGHRVFFVEPADGATVTSPVKMVFGAEGVEIRAAGELVAGSGHHHVVVDGGPVEAGAVVPKDDRHIHYGLGQTEATLPLVPGPHTLTLQLADGLHRSYGPGLTATISVVVANPSDEPPPAEE